MQEVNMTNTAMRILSGRKILSGRILSGRKILSGRILSGR
jgi:hypothetical protein